ncbi:hypothetical protein TNCV_485271 [Trichonephila clavipes]|nr:hypothetical protein TNCV_485271 [Trichonephila clavipes]
MAPRRPETSRPTETVNQTPPIQNRNVTPQISTAQAPNLNFNIPNANNSDIKALLSTTVQCLIQLLNAMNTAPAIANNFDKVNSAQVDSNQIKSGMENGWRLQGKLADGTVVAFETGASLFTEPISDVGKCI